MIFKMYMIELQNIKNLPNTTGHSPYAIDFEGFLP